MTQLKLGQRVELRQNEGQGNEPKDAKPIEISSLFNAVEYFLETVFIMTVKDGYRLLVVHYNELLTDKIYKTVRGARCAFLKIYKQKAWRDGVKAHWSYFCPPVSRWVDKKLKNKKATGKRTGPV